MDIITGLPTVTPAIDPYTGEIGPDYPDRGQLGSDPQSNGEVSMIECPSCGSAMRERVLNDDRPLGRAATVRVWECTNPECRHRTDEIRETSQ